mmetsp:Transcript_55639/g.121179  ORF Transcript_55639/g.121179 Transcript_55639/m.121179 type:complete len:97 (-) Transcript_55639:201-491(-)
MQILGKHMDQKKIQNSQHTTCTQVCIEMFIGLTGQHYQHDLEQCNNNATDPCIILLLDQTCSISNMIEGKPLPTPATQAFRTWRGVGSLEVSAGEL